MRTVALEEHFAAPALSQRISKDIIAKRGYRPRNLTPGAPNPLELLPEVGEIRLKSMDETGITVQVLSNSGPGPDLLPGADGIALARELNDHLAAAVARQPDPFAGMDSLPMQTPDAAVDELKRPVDRGVDGAGPGERARQASTIAHHRRPHGRNAADDDGAHRPGL